MVVCDFTAHIPHVKNCMFSPRIQTWKLRDPATASQFQSAFMVKQWLLQLQLAPLLVLMLILQITLSQLGQSWRAPCWMLTLKFTVSPRSTSGNSKTGGGTNQWMKLYERCVHREKPTVPWRGETWQWRPRGHKMPTLMPSTWQSMLSVWQSLRQRKRNSPPQYSQVVMVFSISPNRWTIQTRMLMRIVYTMKLVSLHPLTKTRWSHALSTMLCFSMPNLSSQATSSLGSLQLLAPSVFATLIHKVLSKMKCSKAAESWWPGRSWACEKIDSSCFSVGGALHKLCTVMQWGLLYADDLVLIANTQEEYTSKLKAMLDLEATFCFLGDMLCSVGSCGIGIAPRCCVAWGKFRKLLPVHGKVCEACIHLAMLHGSKTWGPNNPVLQ